MLCVKPRHCLDLIGQEEDSSPYSSMHPTKSPVNYLTTAANERPSLRSDICYMCSMKGLMWYVCSLVFLVLRTDVSLLSFCLFLEQDVLLIWGGRVLLDNFLCHCNLSDAKIYSQRKITNPVIFFSFYLYQKRMANAWDAGWFFTRNTPSSLIVGHKASELMKVFLKIFFM